MTNRSSWPWPPVLGPCILRWASSGSGLYRSPLSCCVSTKGQQKSCQGIFLLLSFGVYRKDFKSAQSFPQQSLPGVSAIPEQCSSASLSQGSVSALGCLALTRQQGFPPESAGEMSQLGSASGLTPKPSRLYSGQCNPGTSPFPFCLQREADLWRLCLGWPERPLSCLPSLKKSPYWPVG